MEDMADSTDDDELNLVHPHFSQAGSKAFMRERQAGGKASVRSSF